MITLTATVEQVIDLLGGTVIDSATYDIFGHEVTKKSIEMQLEMAKSYFDSSYFTAGIIQSYPQKVDYIIILDTACNILGGQIMGILMESGFSYTVLEHSFNASDFPAKVTNSLKSFARQRDRFIKQITDGVDTYADMDMGENTWDALDEFNADTLPNFYQ